MGGKVKGRVGLFNSWVVGVGESDCVCGVTLPSGLPGADSKTKRSRENFAARTTERSSELKLLDFSMSREWECYRALKFFYFREIKNSPTKKKMIVNCTNCGRNCFPQKGMLLLLFFSLSTLSTFLFLCLPSSKPHRKELSVPLEKKTHIARFPFVRFTFHSRGIFILP